jgi:hypothetical protein
MQTFGYKVFIQSLSDNVVIVERALRDKRPIEVGFDEKINDEVESYLRSTLPHYGLPVNTHLNLSYNVFAMQTKLDDLCVEFERAALLGSDYSIMHVSRQPMTMRIEHWPRLMDQLGRNLECIQAVCEKFDHEVYIENSYHSLMFYDALFEQVVARDLSRIQLCFDFGHAKVWSNQSLLDWLAFIELQQRNGRKLHFHLHTNNGLKDEHLSFVEAQQELSDQDSYLGNWDYLSTLNHIRERFTNSRKIFEVKASYALENMDLVMRNFTAQA